MKKLSNKIVLIISGVILLLLVGVILLFAFQIINQTAFIVATFIGLIAFSSATSLLMNRYFQKKLTLKKIGKTYEFEGELNLDVFAKKQDINYGSVNVYFEKKTIYYVTVVKDIKAFFSDVQESINLKIDYKKYDKAIEFYIFEPNDFDEFRKVCMINYQAKNFYVASYVLDKEKHSLLHSENLEPNDEFSPYVERMLELLNVKEKIDK